MGAEIIKAFENLKESIQVVADLHKKGVIYENYLDAIHQIDKYEDEYRQMINGMLLFGVITESQHSLAYDLLISYEKPSLF